MHIDTSLLQGVFQGWPPLTLQSPKKQKKITKNPHRSSADPRRVTKTDPVRLKWGFGEGKPKIFAENRRKPQIGLCHLRCVTFSSALVLAVFRKVSPKCSTKCRERTPISQLNEPHGGKIHYAPFLAGVLKGACCSYSCCPLIFLQFPGVHMDAVQTLSSVFFIFISLAVQNKHCIRTHRIGGKPRTIAFGQSSGSGLKTRL